MIMTFSTFLWCNQIAFEKTISVLFSLLLFHIKPLKTKSAEERIGRVFYCT